MRNKEVNNGLGLENARLTGRQVGQGCKLCGKRLPARNNQAGFACRAEGLCPECYDNAYLVCKECGDDLPKGKGIKCFAARQLGYCLDCYKAKFPERVIRDMDDQVFHPENKEPSDCPWEWLESVRQMYDETDRYER